MGKQRRTKAMSNYIFETLNGKWFGRTELKLQFNTQELLVLATLLKMYQTGLDFNVNDDILIMRTGYRDSVGDVAEDLAAGERAVDLATNSNQFQRDIAILKAIDSKLAEHILSFHGRMK
jgi:hypothetical protein